MQTLKETQFIKISFDAKRSLYKSEWASESASITEEEIRAQILLAAEHVKQSAPIFYLGDDSNRHFVYSVDIQKWVAETLAMACIQAGVKKFAILMPDDFLAEISTEQTAEEAKNLPIEVKYFKNENDAIEWFGI